MLPSGKVLVTGGFNDSVSLASSELYDPSASTWSATTGPMTKVRRSHTATLLPSGKVLVTGGFSTVSLASSELYDPSTSTWSATTGPMAAARYDHTATLLPSGKVLVTGGNNGSAALTSSELYDPSTGTWSTTTGPLATARYQHTSTLLLSGKVLVAGGQNGGGYLANGELYDPSAGTWSAITSTMATTRRSHTATLLPSGKVLVTGGYNGGFQAGCELYDPGLGFSPSDQPTITSLPATLPYGSSLSLTGTLFTGRSEASSGGTNSSATNYPLVQIQSAGDEQQRWLTYDPASSYTATTVTTRPVTGLPLGPAWVRVFVNGIPSEARALTVTIGTPTIIWPTPTAITYGTALSATQLNATANVAGAFTYSPLSGTVLSVGSQTLNVTFTPTDAANFAPEAGSVTLTVNKAVLTVTAQNQSRAYGAANPTLTATITGYQNSENASVITGSAVLATTASGPSPVTTYPITVDVSGMSATNYSFTGVSGTLTITQSTPVITWAAPASITYGTPLSATQLNATASVGGTFAYTPASGAVLHVGIGQTLSVTFTPTDAVNYASVTTTTAITVTQATLTITADNKTMVAGQSPPTLTATGSGFVSPDTMASLDTAPTLTSTATSASIPGTYPITATGAADVDYLISYVAGTMTVTAPAGAGGGGGGGSGGGGCGLGGGIGALALALLLTLRFAFTRRRTESGF